MIPQTIIQWESAGNQGKFISHDTTVQMESQRMREQGGRLEMDREFGTEHPVALRPRGPALGSP